MSRRVPVFLVRHIEIVLLIQGLAFMFLAYFVVGAYLPDRWRFTGSVAIVVFFTQSLASYFVRTQQRLTRQNALSELEAALEDLLRVETRWLLAQLSASESHSAYEVEKVRYLLTIADYASSQVGLVLNDPLRVKVPGPISEWRIRDSLPKRSDATTVPGKHSSVHLQSI